MSDREVLILFCAQLKKDFAGAGLSAVLPETGNDVVALRQAVISAISAISGQTAKLGALLYRVDVSEKQLSQFSQQHSDLPFDEVVAELLIRRVLQKVIFKKKFSNG